MSGQGTQQGLRRYLGAIKDTTTVGLAKVNSHYKELDISIVRATNHVERPAKEKHIKAIFYAISAARPRADVAYCIHALSRRLAKTHNWVVALKTLLVIHRALREVDPTFREEVINYGRSRGHMLNMSHFKDDSSASAWDYSSFVRTYALYLEERLECFRVLKYDVETDPLNLRGLDTVDLLEQMLALQELLFRLLGCQPQGAAAYNFLIQSALSLVVGESRRIYAAISDGVINLVDKFFEMRRHDAVVALEMYRRAGQQAERLSEFYEICKSIDITRGEKLIKIEQPPASFLTTMEEYVKDAPRASTVRKNQVKDEKPKAILAIEYQQTPEVHETPNPPPPPPEAVRPATVSEQPDFLGLNETNPDASELDTKNALALAIVPVDSQSSSAPTGTSSSDGTTSWELALVTAPSSSETPLATTKLAGGLDKLTLDSLYDEGIRRAAQTASYNPWEAAPRIGPYMQPMVHDAFYPLNAVGAQSVTHSAQMAAVAQQRHTFMLQQQMMFMQQQQQAPLNPFASGGGNPYRPGQQQAPLNPYTGFL